MFRPNINVITMTDISTLVPVCSHTNLFFGDRSSENHMKTQFVLVLQRVCVIDNHQCSGLVERGKLEFFDRLVLAET